MYFIQNVNSINLIVSVIFSNNKSNIDKIAFLQN